MKKTIAVLLSCILSFNLSFPFYVNAEEGDEPSGIPAEEITEERVSEEDAVSEQETMEVLPAAAEEIPAEISEPESNEPESVPETESEAAAEETTEEDPVISEEPVEAESFEEVQEETDAVEIVTEEAEPVILNEPADEAAPEAESSEEEMIITEENETDSNEAETVFYEVLEDGTVIMRPDLAAKAGSSDALLGDAGNALTKLSAPTNLIWGKDYAYDIGTRSYRQVDMPGSIAFKPGKTTQDTYWFVLYKGSEKVYSTSFSGLKSMQDGYAYMDIFLAQYNFTEGDYYFTIQARGDGTQYSDSDIVKSKIWHYNGCSERLSVPTGLSVSGDTAKMNFKLPDSEYCMGYDTEIYFSASANEEPVKMGGTTYVYWRSNPKDTSISMPESYLEQYGAGYYSFRVKAVSGNINAVRNSEYSARSKPVFINAAGVIQDVNKIVNDVNSGSISDSQIRSEVQKLDTEKLRQAMLMDNQNSGVVKDLETLEKKLGGTEIVVKNDAKSSFKSSEISMTGASLNTLENSSGKVSLIVDKPERNDVIPTMYDNTVAVKFSMHLDNVKNTGNLKVPVKIIMPVPNHINPAFLRIIHYKADGSIRELIDPYKFQKDGRLYVSFVLTSFSDFAIVTEKQYPKACKTFGFCTYDGKDYWYENGERQGTVNDPKGVIGDGTNRGREIYDGETNAWYWLDSCFDGAKAVGKEVWMPYIYQDEASWKNDEKRMNDTVQAINSYSEAGGPTSDMGEQVRKAVQKGVGKWVRYDENGKMMKGWVTINTPELIALYPEQKGNTYFYDYMTGLMAKGWSTIGGERHYFDEMTGVLKQ